MKPAPGIFGDRPNRTTLLVASSTRAPFDGILATTHGQVDLRYHTTPMDALECALTTPAPTLVFLDQELLFPAETGAMRLLDRSPRVVHQVVLTGPEKGADRERIKALLAGSRVLFRATPRSPEAVIHILEELTGPLHPWRELAPPIQDLVQGVADAINNPLASLSGFLQLLEIQLGPQPGQECAETFGQIKQSLGVLSKVAADLEVAGGGAELRREVVDLPGLLGEVAGNHQGPNPLVIRRGLPQLTFQGDRALLVRALGAVVEMAQSVVAEGVTLELTASRLNQETLIEIKVPALVPSRWRADRTFHPFFLSRSLQTPEIGLAPAVAAGASRALGGRAEAKWEGDGSLRLTLLLP